MYYQKKRIALLCVLLVISGGWMALASRQSAALKAEGGGQPAEDGAVARPTSPDLPDPPSFLSDTRLPASAGGGLGNGELFFRMMLSVGLVLGLGAAALYLSKRVLPRVARTSGKEIHVVETVYLGPRKMLHLVEVGGQRLLLASTNDSITMLAPVDETWPDLSNQELSEAAPT